MPAAPRVCGGQRLEPAIAVRHRVADEHDLALDVDAVRCEPVVVFRVAAGRVDDRRVDFARLRVRVVVQHRLCRYRDRRRIGSSVSARLPRPRPLISTLTSSGHGSSTSCWTIVDLVEAVVASTGRAPIPPAPCCDRMPATCGSAGQEAVVLARRGRPRATPGTVVRAAVRRCSMRHVKPARGVLPAGGDRGGVCADEHDLCRDRQHRKTDAS